ncbi:MAG: ABC transporter substrate-binding protein [Alkalispirochaetaceae bacterium]
MHSFPKLILLLSLILLALPLAATGVPEEPATITVEDALGRSVSIPEDPSRIVLAGQATFMLVDALYLFPDAGERVVGVGQTNQGLGDFFPVLDAGASEKAGLGRNAGAEEILALRPELVILKSRMARSLGAALESAGATVVYLDLETPEQYARDIRTLGTILGQQQRAQQIVELYRSRVEALQEATDGRERPSVLLLYGSESADGYSYSVPPAGWIQTDQVRLGGGEPVWIGEGGSPGWNQVQFEQIAAWDPEVIVFVSYRSTPDELLAAVEGDPLWQELGAVEGGEVYAMPWDYYSWAQPDSRWVLAAEWFAYLLHGDAFSVPFESRIRAFFREFYGFDEDRYRETIAPTLGGELFE